MARSPKNQQKQTLSLENLALATLEQICLDESAPAAAKGQAARTILEAKGLLRGGAAEEASKRDHTTMSVQEIDAEIKRFTGR